MKHLSRKGRIRAQMNHLEQLGVIVPGQSYTQGQMPGLRWTFTPCGFTERSLTTSQIEDFILGANAALNSKTPLFDRTAS
jgi:hypothetical protein